MRNLSIEELKKYSLAANKEVANMADELIAIRELKGDQVPVAWIVRPSMESDVAYVETDPRSLDTLRKAGVRLTPLFTAPQKPVVLLTDCDIGAVSHMAHWYSEEQCEAWVAGVEHAKKQIVAAGCIVKDGE